MLIKCACHGASAPECNDWMAPGEEERAKNLATIKAWLGEGARYTSRWKARKEVPGVTKDQLEKIKAAC